MLNLVCSPQTRKVLHEKGLVTSPKEEKEVEALRAMATDLSGAINVLKHDKKRERQAAFGAMKSLAFGETVKKKRLTSSVSKLVSLNRWSISKCIKRTAEVLKYCCINRTCEHYGTHLFRLLPEENSENESVKWKRFDYVTSGKVTSSGEQQKKIALVQKETSPKELFQYLIELLDTYRHHQFMAIWQRKQLDDLLENLPLGHVVCIHDYSESYVCRGQNKIQFQYVNKASLRIIVMFLHATMEADGKESTAEEPVVIKEHVFVISDDPLYWGPFRLCCGFWVSNPAQLL